MSVKTISGAFFFVFLLATSAANAQKATHYNLVDLLKKNKLAIDTSNHARVIDSSGKQAITLQRIAWLKNLNLKNGIIDIDLRGKDVFLNSFLGVAFHASDSTHYDVIFFRPFRFHSIDTPTRNWSVQYMGMPDHDYDKLRKAHPGVYENYINPVPDAADWFHATIILKGDWITVYVNHSKVPSMKIQSLNSARDGSIGLWADGLTEDFANLSITR